jgi:hypothetical protein
LNVRARRWEDEVEVSGMRRRTGSFAAACGALAFLAAQLPLLLGNGAPMYDNPGWFTNAGFNIVTIGLVVAAVAVPVSFSVGWPAVATYGVGAFVAMTVVLFTIGPGNLFPITLFVGGAVLACATAAGGAIGLGVRALRLRYRT